MSEYLHVEKPFLNQLDVLGWTVIDQGQGFIPFDPKASLRDTFREWLLPEVFRNSVRNINLTADDTPWLTDRQFDDLRSQILRQPNRTMLEANEVVQALFLKAQVDRNEVTGEPDPVVQLIDFTHPERNQFHAINQFRIDTPGYVKKCIIPDIVLFVNGIPLVVIEAKVGDATTANPMHAAFEQLLRYCNGRNATTAAGLREGEPRLFHTNLLLIRTCGEKAEFGSITSGHEHFCAWKDIWPESNRNYTPPLGVEREQERLIQGLLAPATLLDVLRTCTVFMDTDSGKKVKALINEHLIDLGINPKIPPIELLSDDFIANVQKHSQGNPEAKASEMEHAIRKHCTIHFDEDPAFYKRLSEKLEKLIQEHKDTSANVYNLQICAISCTYVKNHVLSVI